jgi:hypothetical protein
MEEARRVIDRLGRIDALRSAGANSRALLVELRELVREGQAWTNAEGPEATRASGALKSLAEALDECAGVARATNGKEVVLRDARL